MKGEKFDFGAFKQEALSKLRNKEPGATAEKLFKPLFKQFIEEALQAEMEGHLDDDERSNGNRRNDKSSKTVKSTSGEFDLDTPRDRSGSFKPQPKCTIEGLTPGTTYILRVGAIGSKDQVLFSDVKSKMAA